MEKTFELSFDSEQRQRLLEEKSCCFKFQMPSAIRIDFNEVKEIANRIIDEERFDQINYKLHASGEGRKTITKNSVDEVLTALRDMNTSDSFFMITRADEVSQDLADLASAFISQISEVLNIQVADDLIRPLVTLFVSSPKSVTPYHFDHTYNFLMQIQGTKSVWLYDQHDPKIINQLALERFYSGLGYDPKPDSGGICYELLPGEGVHHPINAPHEVINGDEPSISISIGLCLRSATKIAYVHQFNFVLRRMGFNPSEPQISRFKDKTKAALISALSPTKQESYSEIVSAGGGRLRRILNIKK